MNYLYLTFLVLTAVFPQAKGFCGSRGLDANLTRAAIRAAEWLRNYQDKHGTYGEGHVNGFAFHSLRLVGHSVEHGAEVLNAEIIKQGGVASIPGGPLAVYILGALATCHDPWKFYGLDLVTSLYQKLDKFPQLGFNHPFQYSLAIIALCTAGKDVGQRKYWNYIIHNIPNQTAAAHASGDTLSMHVFALTCVKEFAKKAGQSRYKMRRIQGGINAAIKILYKRQLRDGTFAENEVTAALSYQALLAGDINQGKCAETMNFLLSRQKPDGSFKNLGATIYVLPSLVGALPYDVNRITCPENKTVSEAGDHKIRVCVELKFNATKYTVGKRPPSPVCVEVRNGTNAHEILKLAATQDPCFNFTVKMTMWGHSVRSICGIHRVPADKVYWMIYIDGKSASTGIDYLIPGDGSTLVFVYKQLFWRK